MKNHTKIIQFLIEHQEKPWTIRAISKHLKINYKIVYEDVHKLAKEKIITITRLGNSNQCTFNYIFNEKTLAAEEMLRKSLLKTGNIKIIYDRISEIQNPFYLLLIFGSYAKHKATRNSDVDVCLITDNQEIREKIAQILRTVAFQTHLVEFSPAEFISMLKTTDFNVGKEIVKYRVILKGAEDFYEMISHARPE